MQLDPERGYDLIGDIHGCGHALARLLPILRASPDWPGGWKLAGEAFALRDDHEKAQTWFDRIERMQAAG